MSVSRMPGLCNTQAQNTLKTGLRSLVDWVSATIPPLYTPQEILELLGLNFNDFVVQEWGVEGYQRHVNLGNIKLYYDHPKEDMGLWLDITGSGCRFYESLELFSWGQVLQILKALDGNITRIDLAVDDFKKYLDLDKMTYAIVSGTVRSKFKKARYLGDNNLGDGTKRGHTIYFGSSTSRLQVRFYDKILERNNNNVNVQDDIKHWVRAEIQFRHERAERIAQILINNGNIGLALKGTLKNYITFCVKSNDTNKSRWKVVKWWDKFLGDIEALKLTDVAPDFTIEKTYNWVENKIAPTLAMLAKAFDGDIGLIYNLIQSGEKRLSKRHEMMINNYLNKNKKNLPNMSRTKDS